MFSHDSAAEALQRRTFLALCSRLGLATTLMPGVLWAMAEGEPRKITKETIDQAAAVAGLTISDPYKEMLIEGLANFTRGYEKIHALNLPNSIAPAAVFTPILPGMSIEGLRRRPQMSAAPDAPLPMQLPADDVLAFYSVRQLAELLRTRKISSSNLVDLYLGRLKRYNPQLKFVITFTEDRARAQAKDADSEIAAGKYRGPLHGIPWGAKDLLAVKGYPTTWGAGGFEQQSFDEDATVVQRLDQAGAVLIAKLTLGALAQGDKWFGGMTRNPWRTTQGSSGSSAGSSAATAAGCVGFAIGSETLGSISSPSTRCGVTGLRPTFGLVPRTGAMALSWSMDKLGPLCRSVEDCALVLGVVYGPDGRDNSVQPAAFNWDANLDWKKLRVGYLKAGFDPPKPAPDAGKQDAKSLTPEEQKKQEEQRKRQEDFLHRQEYDRTYALAALDKLREMGLTLIPVELPALPYDAMRMVLVCEAAAAFDGLTRSGADKLLTEQSPSDWPNTFRQAHFIPAVEYINAMRARTLAMQKVARIFEEVDVIVAPSAGDQLIVTNLTGHPALILPNGFRGADAAEPPKDANGLDAFPGGPGTPLSLTFLGGLYGEAKMLALARAYQNATGFHLEHPRLQLPA